VEAQTAVKGVDVVALVNISAEKWPPRQRTYFGSLAISSPQPGEAFATMEIHGCLGVMDLGDKRTMEFRITAREIAEDIARELNGDSGEGSYHGVFVAAGEVPTENELAEARRRLEEFHRRLVAAADLEWERTKNPMFITDLERRAARQLGLEKPWLYRRPPARRLPRLRGKDQARSRRVPLRGHAPRIASAVRSACGQSHRQTAATRANPSTKYHQKLRNLGAARKSGKRLHRCSTSRGKSCGNRKESA
jgi:hypothetical protein